MDETELELRTLVERIHGGCFTLVKEAVGRCLPVAGNVAIFCQSDEDFERFNAAAKRITLPSDNPDQKYFRLKDPIAIPATGDVPEARYSRLYIRRPNPESPQAGDIDFVLHPDEYTVLKQQAANGSVVHAHVYDRAGWDMIELADPAHAAAPYISTPAMAEKVRIRF